MDTLGNTAITKLMHGEIELPKILGIDAAAIERLRARAQFYINDEQLERALIMLRMVSVLDGTDTMAAVVTARLLLKLGRGSEAESLLERIVAREPDHLEALAATARVHCEAGQLPRAALAIERILRLDPDFRSRAGKEAQALAHQALAPFLNVHRKGASVW